MERLYPCNQRQQERQAENERKDKHKTSVLWLSLADGVGIIAILLDIFLALAEAARGLEGMTASSDGRGVMARTECTQSQIFKSRRELASFLRHDA